MRKTTIGRRAMLKGVLLGGGAVTIPLPRLGAMLNGNGTAYAAGPPIQRFGVYFIGNGFLPSAFAPQPRRTGPLGDLGPTLAPLEKVKAKLTVVSGFDLKTGRPNDTPHGHFPGGLTGANGAGRVYHAPSIDQIIALRGPLGQGVDYKSIEVAVANATPGVSQKMYQAVSAKGMGQHNDPEYSPMAVFNRLFKAGAPASDPPPTAPPGGGGAPAVPDPITALEKSVLDAVRADAAELKRRLGREDQARLDSHLEGIRSIEQRLLRGSGGTTPPVPAATACKQPAAVTRGAATGNGLDAAVADLHADVLVTALACDRTRVFTFQLTKPAAHVNYGIAGVTGDFHGISHGYNDSQIIKGNAYTIGIMARFLEKMDAIKEGDATMLDNSTVLLSSCVSWGKAHTPWEWPCVIAGRGGLKPDGKFQLQGGWHYRSDSADNFSKVLLTLANVNGCNLKELGLDGGRVTAEAPGIRGPTG
jgi:hypothetical protein